MADKKITKRENFTNIMNYLADNGKTEWAEVMAHEIELLSRKASKSATLSPAQKDALAVGEIIRDILSECADPRGMTVGALIKHERVSAYVKADGNGVSSQMVTSILSKNPSDFVRTLDKKVAYYALNYGVEGEGEGD